MRALRIEHPFDGMGPFYTNGSYLDGMMLDLARMPTPLSDGMPSSKPRDWEHVEYVFAFRAHTFRKWVSANDKRILHANGFVLRVYDVRPHDYLSGKSQIVFARERARLLETCALVEGET